MMFRQRTVRDNDRILTFSLFRPEWSWISPTAVVPTPATEPVLLFLILLLIILLIRMNLMLFLSISISSSGLLTDRTFFLLY